MPRIVSGLVQRKKFVYLCTNGLLLKNQLAAYRPSSYLTFSVHLDGERERHDALAGRPGVFDSAVEVMRLLRARGFRFIVNCTVYAGVTASKVGEFFDFVLALGAEGITLSPGYSYAGVPPQSLFLERVQSKLLFREVFKLGKGRRWRFNQSSLFLDFLAGNRSYQCTPWGNPTRNVLGWQKPCYLLAEGYARTFQGLLEETDWSRYGPGRHPQCTQCMLHSGFEATAVNDTFTHPIEALSVFLKGPQTGGPLAREPGESGEEGFESNGRTRVVVARGKSHEIH
jgi:hopanoid biosynthesis associated radical SAM protein HpnH